MANRDVVVLGGSAGSHTSLRRLLGALPADLPAAVLVCVHLSAGTQSSLADILAKDCRLPVVSADDGMVMKTGRVYVAVVDRHLLIDAGDVLRLGSGPRENRVRPAVDALFRAAARWCGPRTIGVVLSGSLDDGAAGLAAIVEHGGSALVQDPQEARFPGMPSAALAAVPSAVTAPAALLSKLIATQVGQPVDEAADPDEALVWETDMTSDGRSCLPHPGMPVALGCPECGGGMREVATGRAVHYTCHVGHSWSPQSFIATSDDKIEEALWTAISALEEKATMLRGLASRAEHAGDEHAGYTRRVQADQVAQSVAVLRGHLTERHDPGRV